LVSDQREAILGDLPRWYGDLAEWWPLLSSADVYAEVAGFYRRLLVEACDPPLRTVLELGCGVGMIALQLKGELDMTAVDQSRGVLDVSRAMNPECEHIEGDIRTIRLGRAFDAVLMHEAVPYFASEDDLRAAIATAFAHCRPGGAALFAPAVVSETFLASTEHGGRDSEQRALRYLEWAWDPDPTDQTYRIDVAYLLRGEDGMVTVEHDRHVEGLFSRALWLRLLREAGFEPEVRPSDHGKHGGAEAFLARRPSGAGA
jgi:SAM-dependent methyltransferase